MRLKDVDALEKALNDAAQGNEHFLIDIATVKEIIKQAPTVNVPQWVSVKDKLPEKSGYVLVCLHYPELEQFEQHDGIYANGIDVAFFATWNNIFLTDNNNAYNADLSQVDMTSGHEYVTHWMPLPESPKEENDAEE